MPVLELVRQFCQTTWAAQEREPPSKKRRSLSVGGLGGYAIKDNHEPIRPILELTSNASEIGCVFLVNLTSQWAESGSGEASFSFRGWGGRDAKTCQPTATERNTNKLEIGIVGGSAEICVGARRTQPANDAMF
ncbi:hypothetical protein THAOC_15768 [Thalassiosira oceanica]|uniref:Uncharacterized protein n=1 Tax=Thalassiosira oceanica TaxID=159749 RepID=K0SRB0_THAOC|nr:hypothetical protein THAOC_15768 [Thalassiosira oceanica]|eukprot:EJK63566.1 hypothetical protein THAOC_15768 [Thalassiosira oceanica]